MNVNYAEDETKRPYGVTATQPTSPCRRILQSIDPDGARPSLTRRRLPASRVRTRGRPNVWKSDVIRSHAVPDLDDEPARARAEPALGDAIRMPRNSATARCISRDLRRPDLITGPTPVYFASGIYYFENTVTSAVTPTSSSAVATPRAAPPTRTPCSTRSTRRQHTTSPGSGNLRLRDERTTDR